MDERTWARHNRNLAAVQELTAEIHAAVNKYLTAQIGHPRGCGGAHHDATYPDREDIKRAINRIWRGLHVLYQLDPDARKVPWITGLPFVSLGDEEWLVGWQILVDRNHPRE